MEEKKNKKNNGLHIISYLFVGADNPRTCGSDLETHTSGWEPAPVVTFSICNDECHEKGPPHIREYKVAERSHSLGTEKSGKRGPRS